MRQSVFVIAGMHRSGTSFTASLLQSAGLDIGQRLLGPGNGNAKGFFESLDFIEFHQSALRSQGLNDVGWTLQPKIEVDDQHLAAAKELIANGSRSPLWGWKDPRTTLFLDFWADLLPEANFLLIYRAPWEVVDSLYRRGDQIFLKQPDLAVEVWMYYNQRLLQFCDKYPERCLLASIYSISSQTEPFIQAINAKFKVNLVTPASSIYEQSLFHTQPADLRRLTLIGHYFPEALEIYQELNAREVRLDNESDLTWLEQIKSPPTKDWAFEDWIAIRNLERQVKTLRTELEQYQPGTAKLEQN